LAQLPRQERGTRAFLPQSCFHNWISDRIWVPHSSGCAFQPEEWETTEVVAK
jgi:hypothetical protein